MFNLDAVAEKRIREALERGEFDKLPGTGKPLALEDDPLVPPETRMAYRVLKNAGLVPVEVLERREIAELEKRAASQGPGQLRLEALQKLALLRTRLGARRAAALNGDYARKILDRWGGGRG